MMEYDPKRGPDPGSPGTEAPADETATDGVGMPFCVKPFASETARFEDEDDPCQNGEG